MTESPAKKSSLKKAATKKTAAKKSSAKKSPSSPQALAQELFSMLSARLGSGELILPGDVDALIASLSGPSAHEGLDDAEADKKDEAQQIAFDAMEAETEAEAHTLAKRALRLIQELEVLQRGFRMCGLVLGGSVPAFGGILLSLSRLLFCVSHQPFLFFFF